MDSHGQLSIICFASEYWDEPAGTDPHHHTTILSRTQRILYVEPGLSILGCIRGWKRLQRPWKRLFPWVERINPNLHVVYMPALPGANRPVIARLNQWLVATMLTLVTRWFSVTRPILWFYHPQFVYLIKCFQAARVVCYDCIDEFSEFPSVTNIKRQILHAEDDLIQQADLICTTSQHLYTTRKQKNPATYYLPNAADVPHFRQAQLPETSIPDDLNRIPSPRIGFVGAISQYKLDIDLLQCVAESHPEWQLVIIGPLAEGETLSNLGKLPTSPNVHLLGPRAYKTLPGYLKGFDACLIPYHLNQYTQGVFPMKFYEYMATGKPIVTTALPSLLEFDQLVKIAHSHEEFITAIEQVLRDDPNREARLKAAEGHTWEARTEKIMQLIQQQLQKKERASR
jgi:glycosyltransferase involved in cell wall biosynthesis